MSDSLRHWESSSAIAIFSRCIEPPANRDVVQRIANSIIPFPSLELFTFYVEGAAECDVGFTIRLPEGMTIQGVDDCSPSARMAGGFSIAPITKLLSLKNQMCKMFDSVPEDDSNDAHRFKPFVDFAIPLSINQGGDYVVYLGENDYRTAGIYVIEVESLLDTEIGIKYADSLFDWLHFLEHSCYIEPRWCDCHYWHDGVRLSINEIFRRNLLNIIDTTSGLAPI